MTFNGTGTGNNMKNLTPMVRLHTLDFRAFSSKLPANKFVRLENGYYLFHSGHGLNSQAGNTGPVPYGTNDCPGQHPEKDESEILLLPTA